MLNERREQGEQPSGNVSRGASGPLSAAPSRPFLPNLFILGVAKCGTSTLHAYLADMPDICMSEPKEPFYFEAEYESGLGFYQQKYFAHWQGEPVIGEARHRNLYLPFVPDRIQAVNRAAKLIVMVRNPIVRAFSHWYHNRWHRVEALSFPAALREDLARIERGLRYETAAEAEEYVRCFHARGQQGDGPYRTYLDSGYYLEQIERYLRRFPRESLKVILFEDLVSRPREVVSDVVQFLGLDCRVNQPVQERRENLSQGPEPPSWMGVLYHRSGLRRLLPAGIRDRLFHFAYERIRRWRKPRMSRRTRRWLRGHYREHNRRLEEWLGRDLSFWN